MNPLPVAAESLSVPHTHPLGPAAELCSSLHFPSSSSTARAQPHLPPQHLVAAHGVAGGHLRLPDADHAVLEGSWRRGAVICRETGWSLTLLPTSLPCSTSSHHAFHPTGWQGLSLLNPLFTDKEYCPRTEIRIPPPEYLLGFFNRLNPLDTFRGPTS